VAPAASSPDPADRPRQIVVFGCTEAAQLVTHFLAVEEGPDEVVAYTVDREFLEGRDAFDGRPLVAFEDLEDRFPPDRFALLVASGYRRMNALRKERFEQGRARGYRFASYISPHAIVNATRIGCNNIIFEGCVIQPFVSIGDNNLVWSGTTVGHHTTIGSHNFLGAHVLVSGRTTLGDRCFVGGGAVIREGVRVGSEVLIGAQAWLAGDAEDGSVWATTPTARFPYDSRVASTFL